MKKTFCFLVTCISCVFGLCPIAHVHDPCDGEKVKFYINTMHNPIVLQRIYFNDTTNEISDSFYTPLEQTKIFIHGFLLNPLDGGVAIIRQGFFDANPSANVISVDYSKVSTYSIPCYAHAVYNVRYAGKCIAKFITALRDMQEAKLDLHVLGHSLGAQVIPSVADGLKPYKIPRATGLDPAGPLFYTNIISKHLSTDSGDFVDIIHTDGLLLGTVEAQGHADFYANGGILVQPECHGLGVFPPILCSHIQSLNLYAESITTDVGFYGYKCDSVIHAIHNKCKDEPPYALMGEHADPKTRGIFYVPTNLGPPYAKG